jgi:hypothetical protein
MQPVCTNIDHTSGSPGCSIDSSGIFAVKSGKYYQSENHGM